MSHLYYGLTANLLLGKAKKKTVDGRKYLVAPITIIRQGVLNGSRGPLLYRMSEMAKSAKRWDDIPIVLEHPVDGEGKPITANSPEILDQSQLGFLKSTTAKDGSLKAEGWFDVEKTEKIAPSVLRAIQNGEKVEVSTGLGMTIEDNSGVFNGREYEGEATEFKPDHLAILLRQKGACSIDDGCGIHNEENPLAVNELSHSDLHSSLQKSLYKRFGDSAYLVDIFDKTLVFHQGDSLYRIGYSTDLRTDDGQVMLDNSGPDKVRRVTSYRPVANSEKSTVDRKKTIIQTLTANCDCWKSAGDAEILNGLPLEKLEILHSDYLARKTNPTNPTPVPVANSTPTPPPAPAAPPTADEWLAAAPPEVQTAVRNAIRVENAEKARCIDVLTANLQDGDDKNRIRTNFAKKSLDELRDLVSLIPQPKQSIFNQSSDDEWIGSGAPSTINRQREEQLEELPVPVTNWAELAKSNR